MVSLDVPFAWWLWGGTELLALPLSCRPLELSSCVPAPSASASCHSPWQSHPVSPSTPHSAQGGGVQGPESSSNPFPFNCERKLCIWHFWLPPGSPLFVIIKHNSGFVFQNCLMRAWFGSQRRALDGFALCLPTPMTLIHLHVMWVPQIN